VKRQEKRNRGMKVELDIYIFFAPNKSNRVGCKNAQAKVKGSSGF
jgi:hypothetical protein